MFNIKIYDLYIPMESKNINEQLNTLLRYYLTNNKEEPGNIPEFEARFGTRRDFKKISKIDYDNVIQELQRRGFISETMNNKSRLDIRTQYKSDVGVRDSSIRVELNGMPLIQEYCRADKLDAEMVRKQRKNIRFIQKQTIMDINGEPLRDVEFSDFNFTLSFKNERKYASNSDIVTGILNDWQNMKKTFRYINRIVFRSPDYHKVEIHMSIVKTSSFAVNAAGKREPMYFFNVEDSGVFQNEPSYEIEFEFVNRFITKDVDTPQSLTTLIHKVSKYILCGLQNTNFPISNREKEAVLDEYAEILYPGEKRKMNPSYFIGPSSVTLQMHNILPPGSNTNEPSIVRGAFCVTDKADGERHMLLVSQSGKIYLINTNMEVTFTGTKTSESKYFQTIMDGELIRKDKTGEYINRFAAFDIYFLKGKDIRKQPFMLSDPKQKTRLQILNLVAGGLVPELFQGVGSSHVSIVVKTFISSNNMFNDCRTILNESSGYEYNVDGLIFTHKTYGVGANSQDSAGPLRLTTWTNSFKWKPSEYNTIDFLIATQKDSANNDVVSPRFVDQITTFYKTLILQCGYSEKDHGYLNPVIDVVDKLREKGEQDMADEKKYKPVQFAPTNPSNYSAGVCHLTLKSDGKDLTAMTEDMEIIEDNTIVEFKFNKQGYDNGTPIQQCWIPIRVRHDKTAKYRQFNNVFGNAYHTANSNWHSIHHPITREMISGLEPPKGDETSSDVYYNNSSKKSQTEHLRNFHNIFVKKILIGCVTREGNTLIDYGCGKGGDLPKWIGQKLSFVLGIDYSKDNIENRKDGAYARYLNYSKKFIQMPSALFVNGDCSKNIRNGSAVEDDMYKEVIKSVFGQSEKDRFKTHMGIYDAYGLGTKGFNVSSCQFALHYFFKSVETLHGFMRNVSECTAMNGYFIGTCYDGQMLLHELSRYNYDEGLRVYDNQQLICEIIKQYDSEEFVDNEMCLGKKILVYQDSINQYLPEYLVNFRYLVKIANLYGFELLAKQECKQLNLPMAQSEGMFYTLFTAMRNSANQEYADALQMSEPEKFISFLNRYFVFKKTNDVNAETVYNSFVNPVEAETILMSKEELSELNEEIGPMEVKPLQSKLVLTSSNEEPLEALQQPQQTEEEPIKLIIEEPTKKKRVTKKVKDVVEQEGVEKKKRETKKAKPIVIQEEEPIIVQEEEAVFVTNEPLEEPKVVPIEEKKKRVAKKAVEIVIPEINVEEPSKKKKTTKKAADEEGAQKRKTKKNADSKA
jgi:hypothetical protein